MGLQVQIKNILNHKSFTNGWKDKIFPNQSNPILRIMILAWVLGIRVQTKKTGPQQTLPNGWDKKLLKLLKDYTTLIKTAGFIKFKQAYQNQVDNVWFDNHYLSTQWFTFLFLHVKEKI